jgi:hypothetical protein
MFKIVHHYVRGRFERFYFKNHWHFVLDLFLLIMIIVLVASLIAVNFYKPVWPSQVQPPVQPVINLNHPPLDLEITPDAANMKLETGLVLRINYHNTSRSVINNFQISLISSDDNYLVSKLVVSPNEPDISLDANSVIFKDLTAGASGQATVTVYFKELNQVRVVNWRAESQYDYLGQHLQNDLSLPTIKIQAQLAVKAAAYYTSPQGDQLGAGPLPPVVGIPTNYWIFLEATSPSNWHNLIISARLPKGLSLTDRHSLLAGEFNYNTSTRQLIWKNAELVGRPDSYRLGFEVQLIPTASQLDKVLPLLSNTQYYATDALTGQEASGTLEQLTTNLDQDRFNSGQGRVVAQ